jgi:hypothetical protein
MNNSTLPPAFFNEPAELAYLASCGYNNDPIFFPEPVITEHKTTETVFNTESLTFTEIQPDEPETCLIGTCVEGCPDSKLKYCPTSCSHPSFVCKTCLQTYIKNFPQYQNCPTCRNSGYCPRLAKQTITRITGYTTKPITAPMITRYRQELEYLKHLQTNGDYYRDNILDKEFTELTPYEQLYCNIHHVFTNELNNGLYYDEEAGYAFYIKGNGYTDDIPNIEHFNTPETVNDLLNGSVSIVARNEAGRRYECLHLNFYNRKEFAELVAEQIYESPLSVSSSFLFHNLIQQEFKRALGEEEHEIWRQLTADYSNADFLRAMLRPMAEVIDIVYNYYIDDYHGDDIEDLLGMRDVLNISLTTMSDGKEEVIDCYLCVDSNSVLF